jgi:hypothetical protein
VHAIPIVPLSVPLSEPLPSNGSAPQARRLVAGARHPPPQRRRTLAASLRQVRQTGLLAHYKSVTSAMIFRRAPDGGPTKCRMIPRSGSLNVLHCCRLSLFLKCEAAHIGTVGKAEWALVPISRRCCQNREVGPCKSARSLRFRIAAQCSMNSRPRVVAISSPPGFGIRRSSISHICCASSERCENTEKL